MQRRIVKSSIIQSIGYDKEKQVLEIEFRTGEVRGYREVPQELYNEMKEAKSLGKFYLKYIRKKFEWLQIN